MREYPNVYVVVELDYSDHEILKIFYSKEEAYAYRDVENVTRVRQRYGPSVVVEGPFKVE